MFVSSAMLDFDHVLTLWMSSGKLDHDFKRIYRLYTVDAVELKKIISLYLPLHSFEFVLAIPVIALILGIPMIGLALSLGIMFHLIIDIHWWRTKLFKGHYWNAFLFYWFTYRLKKHFDPYDLTP